MDLKNPKFPFPASFQLRSDERTGLEALFEKTFFDKPFSAEARKALLRTSYLRVEAGAQPSGVAPPSSGREAACAYPGDSRRFVLLYRGADGIGKTRIFRRFRESAAARSLPVYEVHHHDVEGIPFKPFLVAIREILRDHDQGDALLEKYRYGLEDLLPDLYGRRDRPSTRWDSSREGSDPGADDEKEEGLDDAGRVRILDAITHLLIEVTRRRPLLILVHDLHWSDRPTVELLQYIGRNMQLLHEREAASSRGGLKERRESLLSPQGATGPELEGFESGEWRTLSRSATQGYELLGVQYYAYPLQGRELTSKPASLDELPEGQDSTGEGVVRRQSSLPRLMVLANYRGFHDGQHYLEKALRDLGNEPFAYHGELRPLGREEARPLLESLLAGPDVEGPSREQAPELGDALFDASEGFPSFIQELLWAMHLGEGPFGAAGAPQRWSAAAVRSSLPAPDASKAAPAAPSSDGEESPPLSRRHAILRLRVESTAGLERRVLEALAVARRSISASVIASLLDDPGGEKSSSGDVLEALCRLEARGIVERPEGPQAPEEAVVAGGDASGREASGPAEAAHRGYFFRLWDYVRVVDESFSRESRETLHQRMGDLRAAQGSSADPEDVQGEAAFEVFYHRLRGRSPRSSLQVGLFAASRLVRSFALERARRVYSALRQALSEEGDADLRLELELKEARLGILLGDPSAAEELLRKAQAALPAATPPERRMESILIEAEAASKADPARGLKVLGRVTKLLKDENTSMGMRVQLWMARLQLERGDTKRAINYSLKGINISQRIGDTPELGELYRVMAAAFYRKGDYVHAVDNYERALDAFDRLKLQRASVGALDELGRVYLERGNHFRAARFLYKALEIRRRRHDFRGLCRSYDELGRVYLRSGDYLRTIENLDRSLSLKERIGDLGGLNPTLLILGDLYLRLGRYEDSLACLHRVVENSQRLGDTKGLVDGFSQLGRVHLTLGDMKSAESYSKQVTILASEFKLKSQEGDGCLLEGNLRALRRDWSGAEKCLKQAAEIHGKLGHRRREISAHLDLAETKFARELFDEALKEASKAQIIAEQVKALDLQVRALVIKGTVHRFLKGGNHEKAKEFLHKALEIGGSVSDKHALFELYYALARLFHSQREHPEAGNYYAKAELVTKQIADALSEDRRAKYLEDRRRKTFTEDLVRFRKEAVGRDSGAAVELREAQLGATAGRDRPVGAGDYKDVLQRALSVHAELNLPSFPDRILAESVELTGADRGVLIRVQNRQYVPVAFHNFDAAASQGSDLPFALQVAQDCVRRGRSVLATGGAEASASGSRESNDVSASLSHLGHRSILVVPFLTEDRIFGGVYLDKPRAIGQFLPRDQVVLEAFARHVGVALLNRRELETCVREPLTGFFTASYLVDRLQDAYRAFNLHGKTFSVAGYFVPGLEEALREKRPEVSAELAAEIQGRLPSQVLVAWESPVLIILLSESDVAEQEEIARDIWTRLRARFGENVRWELVRISPRFRRGSDVYQDIRSRLAPAPRDTGLLEELSTLLTPDFTLRDAKKILERHKIESTMRKTGWNITHAARELGIHRPQLSSLLKKHSLRREDGEDEDLLSLPGSSPSEN